MPQAARPINPVVTAGRVKSAMVQKDPAQWHAVLVHLVQSNPYYRQELARR
jgi:hypothetical protein